MCIRIQSFHIVVVIGFASCRHHKTQSKHIFDAKYVNTNSCCLRITIGIINPMSYICRGRDKKICE